MITNVLKYIGVICAALVIGYIVGVRNGTNKFGQQVVSSSSQARETETSTTITETTERPDGSKTTRTVTDTKKISQRDDKKEVPKKEKPRQFRTTVAIRPEWDDTRKAVKVHPMVVISKRLWDSPAWADIIVDPGRKEAAIGISVEW